QIETGWDRSVRGEDVPRGGGGQRLPEGVPGLLGEAARPLEHGKGGVALVEVTDVWAQTDRRQRPPAADPQRHLLLQAHLPVAAVQLAGDAAIGRIVDRDIRVQQVQGDASDLPAPYEKRE